MTNRANQNWPDGVAIEVESRPVPEFHIGQIVNCPAFTDCFGKHVPERKGLVITDITLIECQSIPDYYRYAAREPKGFGYVEGAARYFQAA